MSLNDANKLLKQKFDNHEADVPFDAWSKIEQSLSSGNKTRKLLLWRRVAVAAVLFLSVGVGTIYYLVNKKTDETVYSSNQHLLKKPVVVDPTQKVIEEETIINKKTDAKHKKISSQTSISNTINDTTNEVNKRVSFGETPAAQLTNDTTNQKPLKSNLKSEFAEKIKEFEKLNENQDQKKEEKPKSIKPNNSIGLLTAYSGGSQTITMSEFRSLRSTSQTDRAASILNTAQTQSIQSKSYLRHYLPLTFGIVINKAITSNLSVETGLKYTYLRSDKYQDSLLFNRSDIQELHYLGIPASIVFKAINFPKFSLYMKLGSMVEKNIAGSWREEIKTNNKIVYQVLLKDLENQLQWSTHFGTGINYHLNKRLNLYIEPSISYFPDNKSFIDNIRKHQKFVFSMEGGLKFIFTR